MRIIDCEQGSDEWFAVKRGKVSASHFSEVLNKGAGRGLYMRKLAAERLTGLTEQGYSNKAMEFGVETEAEAKEYYSQSTGIDVELVGFVEVNDWVGCSPDGLIGDDGLIEVKCPLGSTHIDYIIKNKLPAGYVPQVQGQLWVTDRKWCDFVSYVPSMTSKPAHIIRVKREEDYIDELIWKVDKFVEELKKLIAKIEANTF